MAVPDTLTNEQIIHEVICNRHHFAISEIVSVLADILDPATIEHNEIIRFVVGLPCVQLAHLGTEPEDHNCAVCLNKYGRQDHLDKDIPAKLLCGHILGAECIKTWLKRHESCPLCRRKVFVRPEVSGRLNDRKLEHVARDFLFYAKTYLLNLKSTIYRNEEHHMAALMSRPWVEDSYPAFVAWATASGPVYGDWNVYRYGWSGRTIWRQLDPFHDVCSTVACCFIFRLNADFHPHEREACKTTLLARCKRHGGTVKGG